MAPFSVLDVPPWLRDQLQNLLPWLTGNTGNFETVAFGAVLAPATADRFQWDMADPVRPAPAAVAADGGRPAAPAGSATAASGDTSAAGAGGAQGVRRTGRRQRRQLRGRQRANHRLDRPQRRRQEHHLQPHHRRVSAQLRPHRIRGTSAAGADAATRCDAGARPHFPACRDRRRHERDRECRVGAHLRGHAGLLRAIFRLDRGERRCCWPMHNASSIASGSPMSRSSRPVSSRSASCGWSRSPAPCASIRCCCCWTSRRPDCVSARRRRWPVCCAKSAPRESACCWSSTTWISS